MPVSEPPACAAPASAPASPASSPIKKGRLSNIGCALYEKAPSIVTGAIDTFSWIWSPVVNPIVSKADQGIDAVEQRLRVLSDALAHPSASAEIPASLKQIIEDPSLLAEKLDSLNRALFGSQGADWILLVQNQITQTLANLYQSGVPTSEFLNQAKSNLGAFYHESMELYFVQFQKQIAQRVGEGKRSTQEVVDACRSFFAENQNWSNKVREELKARVAPAKQLYHELLELVVSRADASSTVLLAEAKKLIPQTLQDRWHHIEGPVSEIVHTLHTRIQAHSEVARTNLKLIKEHINKVKQQIHDARVLLQEDAKSVNETVRHVPELSLRQLYQASTQKAFELTARTIDFVLPEQASLPSSSVSVSAPVEEKVAPASTLSVSSLCKRVLVRAKARAETVLDKVRTVPVVSSAEHLLSSAHSAVSSSIDTTVGFVLSVPPIPTVSKFTRESALPAVRSSLQSLQSTISANFLPLPLTDKEVVEEIEQEKNEECKRIATWLLNILPRWLPLPKSVRTATIHALASLSQLSHSADWILDRKLGNLPQDVKVGLNSFAQLSKDYVASMLSSLSNRLKLVVPQFLLELIAKIIAVARFVVSFFSSPTCSMCSTAPASSPLPSPSPILPATPAPSPAAAASCSPLSPSTKAEAFVSSSLAQDASSPVPESVADEEDEQAK